MMNRTYILGQEVEVTYSNTFHTVHLKTVWTHDRDSILIQVIEPVKDDDWKKAEEKATKRVKSRIQLLSDSVELEKVKAAVRLHMLEKGNDRCWMDDMDLYKKVLPDEVEQADLNLPPKAEFLHNCSVYCKQYWEKRNASNVCVVQNEHGSNRTDSSE